MPKSGAGWRAVVVKEYSWGFGRDWIQARFMMFPDVRQNRKARHFTSQFLGAGVRRPGGWIDKRCMTVVLLDVLSKPTARKLAF
jgi:hypothetical protein